MNPGNDQIRYYWFTVCFSGNRFGAQTRDSLIEKSTPTINNTLFGQTNRKRDFEICSKARIDSKEKYLKKSYLAVTSRWM